jgi:metal-responsive CopG/Arc/MetJ family transcriptional regulator
LDKIRRVQIQINPDLHRKLNRAAREAGVSKSALVRVALEREFSHQEQLEREIADHQSAARVEGLI